jgi:hypothetical protein
MRHFVKTSVAAAVVMGTALAAGSAFAGIANTRHNLGSTGTGPNHTDSTGEICIFCHTPHGGDTGAPVPLWNKQLSPSAQFTTYDQLGTSTLDAAVDYVGSVSLACLTCHDGTQAIDNIINAPGSGGYNGSGGGTTGLAWNWTTGAGATDGTLNGNGRFVGSVDEGGANIWAIGTNLKNDHPVSMQYGGGPSGATVGATRDSDFFPPIPVPGVSNRWYIENSEAVTRGAAGATTGFDKWDFKLYTRDTGTGSHQASANGATFLGAPEPFVECGSCHDPHFETTTFLRMPGTVDVATNLGGGTTSTPASQQSNRGSAVCLTCHDK